MKTALRVFLAFLAAVIAPAVPILLPSAIGIVMAGSYGDSDVWLPFTRLLSLILHDILSICLGARNAGVSPHAMAERHTLVVGARGRFSF
jgi:hypothetical protein